MTEINYIKLPANGGTPRETANVVNLLVDGKINAAGEVTLSASTTTTTVTDYRVGSESVIAFTPTTAHAAAEQGGGTMYLSARSKQSVTITHANNAQTDRTSIYIVIA